MENKKEYTLKINGIEQSIKDVMKLEDAVRSLDAELGKSRSVTVNTGKAVREHTKALTDEEKAAKKLEETIQKKNAIQDKVNDAQIKANQALREATREANLRVQAERAAANSIEAMRIELSQLKDEWKTLDVGSEKFSEMSEEIRQLNDQIKEAEMGTGDFRRNVGNYESALDGLGKLSEGIEGTTKTSMGLAQSLLGVNSLMSLFGNETDENAESAQRLQKIIALLSIAQQVNENVLKQGIVQNKLAVVTDTIRTTQIKAKTAAEAASTKGTVAATVAQKVFNAVASANPYVLLALALVAVGTALFAFATNTGNAADKQKRLNELQGNYLDTLDEEASRTTRVSNDRIVALERQLKVLEAQEGKQKEIRKLEDEIAVERKRNNEKLRGIYAQELKDLSFNQFKLDEYHQTLLKLQKAQADGKNKLWIDIDLNGNAKKVNVEEAIEDVQGRIDKLGRKVQVAVELNTEDADLKIEEKIRQANRLKEAKEAVKERSKVETDAVRAAEDAKLKLIQDANEQARKQIELTYNRQFEDLRKRLSTETGLTQKARQAMNDQIISLETQKNQELQKLQDEQIQKTSEMERQAEDSRTALIVGDTDRRQAEINLKYDRQIADYKKRLEKDKSLTEEQQKAITELILNAEDERGNELLKLAADEAAARADLELSAVEDTLTSAERKIGEVIKRSNTGLELIDVKATRKNLADTNAALDEYIKGLINYQSDLTAAHEATLATLQKGSVKYEAEMQNYARAMEDTTERIKTAQKEQTDNTKTSNALQLEYYRDLFEKVAGYANLAADTMGAVFDTWNMGLQVQLDDLNEQLDAVNARYEEAQKLREDAAKNVESIEAKLQAATGETAAALRAQLQDATIARNDAAREEQRLAKEKEKREDEIAKKEKKMKRNELLSNIAQATADVAAGVAKALSLIWPLNLVVAGLVGATGAVQIGIMTKQLTKLADGGEIVGPSHANGGVPIPGTNYEVEGGEFVVNKISYGANSDLVKFINDTPRAITTADLMGVLPGSPAPIIVTDTGNAGEDRIIEAIEGINIHPVVAVTDIIDATDEVTAVRDLADF